MKIVTCSLATLMLSAVAGMASADQFAYRQSENSDAFSQRQEVSNGWHDWQSGGGKSIPPSATVTAAPEISPTSAVSAFVLLAGALIMLRGRHSRNPAA